MRAFLLALVALGWLGCREDGATEVRWSGAFAVAVALDEDLGWVEGRLARSDEALSLPAAPGARLLVFELSEGALLGLDGRPLGPEALRSLEVLDRLPAEGCGRCRTEGAEALRLGPGDACPLPGGVRGRVFAPGRAAPVEDPELLDAAARFVRVVWPGPCGRPAARIRSGGLGELCAADGPVPQRIAISGAGEVIGARSGYLVGSARSAPAVLERPGPLGELLAPARPGGPFLLVDDGLREVTAALATRSVSLPLGFRARGAHLDGERAFVFGERGGRAAVARCLVAPGGELRSCRPEDVACGDPDPLRQTLVDGVVQGDRGLAFGVDGLRLVRESGAWRCGEGLRTDGGGAFRPTRVESVRADGERVLLCADGLGPDGPGRIGLISTSFGEVSELEVRATGPGLSCGPLRPAPGRPGAYLLFGGSSGALLVSDDGVEACGAALSCVPEVGLVFPGAALHGVRDLVEEPSGSWAALDGSGRIHRWRPPTGTAELLVGAADREPYGTSALAVAPDGAIWRARGSRSPQRFSPGDTCAEARWRDASPPRWALEDGQGTQLTGDVYPGRLLDRAAAATWVRDELVVAGEDFAAGAPWVRRVDGVGGRVRERRIPEAARALDLVTLGDGVLWVAERGLYWLPPGSVELEPLEVGWDRPGTLVVEDAPNGPDVWRSASEPVDGVVWLVGYQRLARVLVRGDRAPSVEGWWSYSGQTAFGRDLWAAAALDADRVRVAERVYGVDGRARVGQVEVGRACGTPSGPAQSGPLRLCPPDSGGPESGAALAELRPELPGPLRWYAGGLTSTTLVEGWIGRGLDARFLPFSFATQAAASPEIGLVLAAGARWAWVRPR